MSSARGRKPLPSNVHLLRGNPSKLSPDQLRDDVRPVTEIPDAPDHLLPEARAEWDRIAPELAKLGLISQIDRAALAVYCQAYGRWVHAELLMQERADGGLIDVTPAGYRQISALLQVANRAAEQMKTYLTEFGMTPSARTRVRPGDQQPDLFDDGDGPGSDATPSRFFT